MLRQLYSTVPCPVILIWGLIGYTVYISVGSSSAPALFPFRAATFHFNDASMRRFIMACLRDSLVHANP